MAITKKELKNKTNQQLIVILTGLERQSVIESNFSKRGMTKGLVKDIVNTVEEIVNRFDFDLETFTKSLGISHYWEDK